MLIFPYRIISLIIMLCFISIHDVSAQEDKESQDNKDYLSGLFQEVDSREKDTKLPAPRKYDELAKKAISFKLLDKYPKLKVGKLAFTSQIPEDLKGREEDIKKGQD